MSLCLSFRKLNDNWRIPTGSDSEFRAVFGLLMLIGRFVGRDFRVVEGFLED
jgi:hypothetical protein